MAIDDFKMQQVRDIGEAMSLIKKGGLKLCYATADTAMDDRLCDAADEAQVEALDTLALSEDGSNTDRGQAEQIIADIVKLNS